MVRPSKGFNLERKSRNGLKRFLFFFFKQKTAYEMRIRDWSSDVCSADLARSYGDELAPHVRPGAALVFAHGLAVYFGLIVPRGDLDVILEIGRASCRGRVCQSV